MLLLLLLHHGIEIDKLFGAFGGESGRPFVFNQFQIFF